MTFFYEQNRGENSMSLSPGNLLFIVFGRALKKYGESI